jgi:two-component system chemotaxis response regulator CheV
MSMSRAYCWPSWPSPSSRSLWKVAHERHGSEYRGIDRAPVARNQIVRTLDAMAVNHISTSNGAEAWSELNRVAETVRLSGGNVRDAVQLVLTDVEMPEMDGYMLAKRIKTDPRFNGISVIMHSSLSGESNQQLGRSVGIDEYVSKFEPAKLAAAISRMLA